jgi:benzoyl-CoA reductase/2-hydroxyglutaryl-CoA dehydratase subunit BcrC/BadD/HgdB
MEDAQASKVGTAEDKEPAYVREEINAVKTILAAYFHPETTLDKGEGVTAFMMELAELSRNKGKFLGLMKLAKTSASALLELEVFARKAFRVYVEGEEAFLNELKETEEGPIEEVSVDEKQSKTEVE